MGIIFAKRKNESGYPCVRMMGNGFGPFPRSWMKWIAGIKEVDDGIWLVSFMDYDLGYIDLEEKTLQPLHNPFGPKV